MYGRSPTATSAALKYDTFSSPCQLLFPSTVTSRVAGPSAITAGGTQDNTVGDNTSALKYITPPLPSPREVEAPCEEPPEGGVSRHQAEGGNGVSKSYPWTVNREGGDASKL